MTIQLLGYVEVHTPTGSRVAVSHRATLLLAALACSPNSFVADEVLIERVWEEETPQHPLNALYTLTTRLRKARQTVEDGSHEFDVVRKHGGYVLTVDETQVDTAHFRLLTQQAKNAVRQGDEESALTLYGEALSLWRGEPLSGVKSAWADGVRLRLRNEHREALVGSAELGMRNGRHEEYAPLLHQLSVEHPFDEKITSLLMLALYRSGRQNEALSCFHSTRSRIIEQLGDEPGQELRVLHERILRREMDLGCVRALQTV
ncbi:AfsR/SARP family transcriptional regulator [Streptomyces europaeiscabiei]|uniref:AfsR/SARP family transcriptional regulator n=1 Tax=Streptomyces europaeiscabiei TaxID=146819 RepID=UPI002E138784|nr:AfsR/SARP family transcriptional regulator [Streptomyces europaeiscabiei]